MLVYSLLEFDHRFDRLARAHRVLVIRNVVVTVARIIIFSSYSVFDLARYCSSLICSIQSADFPSSCSTIDICVIAVVGAAPCQCFSPGEDHITSPGWMCSICSPQRCTKPLPAVTTKVCPKGWLCQAVRAPGSNVTRATETRAVRGPSSGSSETSHSRGPHISPFIA